VRDESDGVLRCAVRRGEYKLINLTSFIHDTVLDNTTQYILQSRERDTDVNMRTFFPNSYDPSGENHGPHMWKMISDKRGVLKSKR
jgi:hypothetical protein